VSKSGCRRVGATTKFSNTGGTVGVQNAGMNLDQVLELLKIANGYLHRIKFEYEAVKVDIRLSEAEKCNSVRIYQEFNDRAIEMKKRVKELQLTINRMEDEIRELGLKKTMLEKSLIEQQKNNLDNGNVNQDEVILMNDVLIPTSNMVILPSETSESDI
jgi:hypothetical protein